MAHNELMVNQLINYFRRKTNTNGGNPTALSYEIFPNKQGILLIFC